MYQANNLHDQCVIIVMILSKMSISVRENGYQSALWGMYIITIDIVILNMQVVQVHKHSGKCVSYVFSFYHLRLNLILTNTLHMLFSMHVYEWNKNMHYYYCLLQHQRLLVEKRV